MTDASRNSLRLFAVLPLLLAPVIAVASVSEPDLGTAIGPGAIDEALGRDAETPPAGQRAARDGPIRLMPRRDLSAPAGTEPSPTPSKDTPIPDIQIKNLGEVDPDAVGTLDETSGGFGADMWLGTPRGVIERLLGRIPTEMKSPAMRSLAQRLLLSVAALPPAGSGAKARGNPVSVLEQRVERLQAMGLVARAEQLMKIVPARARDAGLQRLRVENMLFANNLGGVCAEAKRDADRLVEPYWQRIVIFCQLLSGDNEAATFGANILAENGNFEDKAFLTLVDRLSGNSGVQIDTLPKPTALHLAMLRSANVAVPSDVLSAESPPVLRTVGISPNADIEIRLKAAERAALYGAISPDRLGRVYLSIEFDEADVNNALSMAEENRSPRGRALLYRVARMQSVPTAKAAVMQKAFELAREDVQLSLVVRLYEKTLVDLPVSAELAWFAGDASRALLALGRTAAAGPWLTLLRQRSHRDDDARAARDGMWALALLAQEPRIRLDDGKAMAAWLGVLEARDAKAAAYRAGLALSMMDALGMEPPADYWQRLLRPPKWRTVSMPAPAYRYAMRNAATAGRRGETVLLSLLMLGPEGPALADIELLRETIVALRAVGLEADARALALEAALANGL